MDEMLDLGQGSLLIGDIDDVDLSNLDALIEQGLQDGTEMIEVDTTR